MENKLQTSNSALTTLSHNEFIAAAKQPRYRDIRPAGQRQATLSIFIAEVYKFKGQIAHPEDLADMARSLDMKLMTDINLDCLTMEEVHTSFLHGVTGEYGEYYGINYVTLANWATAYTFSNERLEAIRIYKEEQKKFLAREASARTRAEVEERKYSEKDCIEHINEYYSEIKSSGSITGMTLSQAAAYDYLAKRGILCPSTEEKIEAMKRAGEWLRIYSSSSRRTMMETLDDGYDKCHSISDRDRTIRKAKCLILADWLNSLDSPPDIQPQKDQ